MHKIIKGIYTEIPVYLFSKEEYDPTKFSRYYIGTVKQASSQIIHPAIGPIVCLASIEDAIRLLYNTHMKWLARINVHPEPWFIVVVE